MDLPVMQTSCFSKGKDLFDKLRLFPGRPLLRDGSLSGPSARSFILRRVLHKIQNGLGQIGRAVYRKPAAG